MKKVNVIIERGSDGAYSIYMDYYSLPFGLIGSGSTVELAKCDFFKAQKEAIAIYGDKAKNLQFSFKYDIASFLQIMADRMSLAGLQVITGINQKQLGHYLSGHRNPSQKTTLKIQQSIKDFSAELSNISFVV